MMAGRTFPHGSSGCLPSGSEGEDSGFSDETLWLLECQIEHLEMIEVLRRMGCFMNWDRERGMRAQQKLFISIGKSEHLDDGPLEGRAGVHWR
jgi:hypothetical protein